MRGLLLLALVLTGLGSSAVADGATSYLAPGDCQLQGLIGRRLTANQLQRLCRVDQAGLVGGYEHRPGSHPWIGEHVGKFLHAASLSLRNHDNPALRKIAANLAATLIASQEADGYLGTYAPAKHWSMDGDCGWDVWSHKYNLLGLLAWHELTGDEAALRCCRRVGDLLVKTFGTAPGQINIDERSTHMGMASGSVLEPMVALYRATHDRRYLDWCYALVRQWDADPKGPLLVASLSAGKPLYETANGKAYEMMSCLVGLADLAQAARDEGQGALAASWEQVIDHAWQDITTRRLYLTGTVSHGEHFQADGRFPNTGPVGETCATVTMMQLGLRVFRRTGDARVMDVLERAVYGHLFGAQDADSGNFSYYTPLEGTKPYTPGINCCVSSGPRGIALIPTYAASVDADGGVRLNLYAPGTYAPAGSGLRLKIETRWPYEGKIAVTVLAAPDKPLPLRLRVPQSCGSGRLTVAGRTDDLKPGYAEQRRAWRAGDRLTLDLALPLRAVMGDGPNAGWMALTRGPLVLALDSSRLTDGQGPLTALTVTDEAAEKLPVKVQMRVPDDGDYAFGAEFVVPGRRHAEGDQTALDLHLLDFAHVGKAPFRVWFRRPSAPPAGTALEAWSRDGNVDGSIVDGDPQTFRVTFDGAKQAEDFFEVSWTAAKTIGRVVFVQGKVFHDGGWFDTSAGRPKILVRETPGGPWRQVATLDAYPAATAADAKGLELGQRFEARLPGPVKVVALRVVGRPACGDNPAQSFSSCAELGAMAPE
ncbi:MAG: glycoside hydrolase family 127 protein [Armatimonadetes bacterium]|nr:glycoside hydrolase family 127 protein [Armatimonadota bacterium]